MIIAITKLKYLVIGINNNFHYFWCYIDILEILCAILTTSFELYCQYQHSIIALFNYK